MKAFPELVDEKDEVGDASKNKSQLSPVLLLKRGAENGDCDQIRIAVAGGVDINRRETGEDGNFPRYSF